MKRNKIIFWASTILVALPMLYSAYLYLTNAELKAAFAHLGFADSFRIELAIAKILGAIALLLPFTPVWGRQFAYVGFAITFVSAAIAHASAGDPAQAVITPLIFLLLLAASFVFWRKSNGVLAVDFRKTASV